MNICWVMAEEYKELEEEGRLSKSGVKFGKWFDTVYFVKRIKETEDNPSKPQPYFTEQ